MWWTFFIIFFLISVVSSTLLFYSLRRITQYEEFILQIQQVIKFNKLDARLDSIWDRFLAYGKGLFYIRPTKKTYRIYWFDKDAYRTYYSPEGELEEVIIIYPYKVKAKRGLQGVGLSTDKRYMRLRITATEIEEFHSEQEITFEQENVNFAKYHISPVVQWY